MATISAKEIALAVEGFNRHPALSSIARRLGVELVSRADRRTGTCFPSEARLAAALGCSERSIRRAKVELLEHRLIAWLGRGRRKTVLYRVMFTRIREIALEIKRTIVKALNPLIDKTAAAKRLARASHASQPSGSEPMQDPPPARNQARTFLSAYPSQIFQSGLGIGKGGAGFAVGASPGAPSVVLKAAESRLWADLGRFPGRIMEIVIERLGPDDIAQASEAERRERGAGARLVLDLVQVREAA